tara:strand:+ start:409 stop:540 length:132 start_codon:yes stop_codon:yes gene_type:complete
MREGMRRGPHGKPSRIPRDGNTPASEPTTTLVTTHAAEASAVA